MLESTVLALPEICHPASNNKWIVRRVSIKIALKYKVAVTDGFHACILSYNSCGKVSSQELAKDTTYSLCEVFHMTYLLKYG